MKTDRKVKTEKSPPKLKAVKGSRGGTSRKTNGKHPLAAYEHIPVGVVAASLDGQYQDVNEEFCRIVGYSRKELLQLGIKDCTHEDDYSLDIRLHEQLIAGLIPYYRLEKRFVRKDGSAIWVELTRSLVSDSKGQPLYTIGAVLDISDRKDVERVLRDSVERLRIATESARMFMWEWDLRTQIYTADENFVTVLGFPSGLLPKDSVTAVQKLMLREDWQALRETLVNATADHRDRFSQQVRLREPETGQVAWMEMHGKIVYDESGLPERIYGVTQNITEAKRAQNEIAVISRLPDENPDPVMRLGLDGRVLYANPASASLLASWEQAERHSIPEDVRAASAEAFASGIKREIEIENQGRYFTCTLAPIREAGYVNFYANDISERKRALEDLRLARERAERAADRITRLQKVTQALSESLTPQEVAEVVVRQGSRALGAMTSSMMLLSEDGLTLDLMYATAPERITRPYTEVSVSSNIPAADAVRWGQPVWIESREQYLERYPHLAEQIKGWGGQAAVSIPMAYKGRILGVLNLSFLGELPYTEEDKDYISTLAQQAAQALQRARAEEALRNSEERFRALVSQATAGIAESDLESRLTFVNPRFCEMLGYAAEELLGKTLWELTHTEDLEPNKRLFERMLLQGTSYQFEKRFIRKDGSMVWTNVNVTSVYDVDGRPTGGVGVILDIEQRKQAETALTEFARQQEALYILADRLHHADSLSQVFEAAIDAILVALQSDRASILLYDESNVMRFVAWRGLSEGYRKTTDGHSPWTPDTKNPEPILMSDVRTADLSDSLRAVVQQEGIGALAFIPLVTNGKLIGKFMVYFDRPHTFNAGEIELGLTIAHQLASDIDRKRAEQAVRASEKRFRDIFETAGVSVWVQDFTAVRQALEELRAQGVEDFRTYFREHPEFVQHAVRLVRVLDVNQETLDMFGAKTKAELLQSLDKVFLPETELAFIEEMLALVEGREAVRAETTEQTLDGRRIPVIFTVHFGPRDADLSHVVVTLTDITERKRIEDALRESEARYRFIVENTSDGIWWVELAEPMPVSLSEEEQLDWYYRHAVMRQCNLGLARMYGYDSVEEVTGLPMRTLMPREDPVNLELARQFVRSGYRLVDAESREVGRDGRERVFLNNMVGIVQDGNLIGEWGTNRDITERKRAEEMLRRNEQMLSTLVDAAPFGVYFVDSEFRLRSINNGAEAVFRGIEPLIGRDFAEVIRIIWKEPFATEAIERFQHTLRTGESFLSPATVEERANIHEIQAYDWQIHRITFADGTYGVVCYFYDLTAQKRMEATVRASEALYRALARNIPDGGVYVVDKDFRYLVAEGPVTEAFGLSREMLEGRTVMEVFPDERGKRMEERLRRNFAGERVEFETRFNGRVFWTQQAPLHDALGHAIILTLDITERKHAEEALRESEERFRAILRQATAGIVRKDAAGRFLFVNQAFCEMLGYTEAELLGRTCWDLTYEEDGPEHRRLFERMMADGVPFKFERRMVRKDGSLIWADVSVSPILDADGKPQSAVGVEVDLTARKQAEEALRRSEERFARFMRHLPGLAWIKDMDGRYVYANAAAEKAFNTPRDELYGRTDEDIFPPEAAAQFRSNDVQALQDEKGVQVIETLRQNDGVLHYSLVSKFPIPGPGGETTLIGGTAFDITERRQAEEALRESEERFRAILRQATAGIVRKDEKGRLIFVNEAFCNMLGYAEMEMLGKTIWDFMHEEDIAENKSSYERLMMEGIPFKLERRLVRKDGSIIWVDASVSPLMDPEGRPQSAVAVEVDITARKQAEEALHHLNLQLEERVLSRTEKLRAVNQTLREEIAERQRMEEALKLSEAAARENEEKLRTLFDLLPVGITFLDPQGKIIQMNSALPHILRLSREQLLNQAYASRKYIRADGTPMPAKEFASARALVEGRIIHNVETGIVLESGDVIWTNVSAAPVDVGDVGVVVVTVDITDTKRAERALQESHRRLRILSQRLVEVQEDERRALARELHDRVGQTLAALNINLIIINSQLSPEVGQQIGTRMNDSMQLVAETIALVRDVMTDLRPAVLDDYGLEAALDSHLSRFSLRYNIPISFEKPAEPIARLGPSVEMTLLRIAQEALMNIARHARATQISLSLRQEEDSIHMMIQDNGIGIESWQDANRPGSHGLTIMRERAEAFDGTLQVKSEPGQGTRVEVRIPRKPHNSPRQEKVL